LFVALTLAQLAEEIGAEFAGDAQGKTSVGDVRITGAATLEDATACHVSFLFNSRYQKQLKTTRAGAVIVGRDVQCDRLNLLKTGDPKLAFAKAVIALHGYRRHGHAGAHPGAFVDKTATIGEGTILYPGVNVAARTRIGRDCILYPNVVIYEDCVVGDRVIIHAGASIGHDGFGFATSKGIHHKIPQIGNVVLGDDVEVGPNTTIARAALGSTVIGNGTKIDALAAIGHGVNIGPHGLVVSQVGIAGSTTIGHHATFGGQVGVVGHLEIGNHVTVAAQAAIVNDVQDGEILMGSPSMPIAHGRRVHVLFTKLPELLDRIRDLERRLAELTQKR
jgi:UDP-3-O-[3-hydroxymyristoyl] glucosamine N-acyltransferase